MTKAKNPAPRNPAKGTPVDAPDIQGEGNYDATRRYDKSASDFAKSGKVDEAARAAQPKDAKEAEEMRRAEQAGRSHAKGEDDDMADSDDDEGDTLSRR
jgi:hypothetical protein